MEIQKSKPQSVDSWLERIVTLYGDTIFDLCEKILWSSINAQIAFKEIFKTLKKYHSTNSFQEFERAWILKVTIQVAKNLQLKYGRHLSAAEQMMLDGTTPGPKRLQHFESYFHRLKLDEQVLLLLRDKLGLPFSEISTAMGSPEGSLKIMRQQALDCLEEWIWEIE